MFTSFLVSTGEPNLSGHSAAVDGVHHDSLCRCWFRRNGRILYFSFYRSILYHRIIRIGWIHLKYDMNIILIFRSSEYRSLRFNKQGPSSIGRENLQSIEGCKCQFSWVCILKQCPSSLEFSIWKAYSYGHCFYVQLITFNALINIRPIL